MQDNGDAIIVISIKAENIVEDVHDEVVNMYTPIPYINTLLTCFSSPPYFIIFTVFF